MQEKADYANEQKEKVNQLIYTIDEQLKKQLHSEAELKNLLQFMTKFHQYSLSNIVLIKEQFRGAKAVASFKSFSDQGFKVNRGEKGIKILVPKKTTYFKDIDNNRKQLRYATKEEKEKIKRGEIKTTQFTSFSVGNVFDISQTSAQASDLPKLFPNRWLEGEVNEYSTFMRGMEKVAEEIGVEIIKPKSELGVAKGASYPMTKEVALNPRNSELQNVKTLLHELAHAKIHTMEKRDQYSAAEKEFQAELVAYSVCSYFKLDTSEYSLNYLKNWTQETEIPQQKNLLNEVAQTTKHYISTIEDILISEKGLLVEKEKNTALKEKRLIRSKCKEKALQR